MVRRKGSLLPITQWGPMNWRSLNPSSSVHSKPSEDDPKSQAPQFTLKALVHHQSIAGPPLHIIRQSQQNAPGKLTSEALRKGSSTWRYAGQQALGQWL